MSKMVSTLRGKILRISCEIMIILMLLNEASALSMDGIGNEEQAGQVEINVCTTISSPGNYVLNQSITDSISNACIRIESGDVIFDGRGYTIKGADRTDSYGVVVQNAGNVTVMNLNVADWYHGIYYVNVPGGIIESSSLVSNNYSGIMLAGSTQITISGIAAESNRQGISLSNSNHNIIENSNVSNNDDGIFISSSGTSHIVGYGNNTLEANRLINNSNSIFIFASSNNQIIHNFADENRNSSISLWYSDDNYLRGNVVLNSLRGIYLEAATNNNITGNSASNNSYGILVFTSNNNNITDNNISRNAIGIYTGQGGPSLAEGDKFCAKCHDFSNGYSRDNIIRQNMAVMNTEYGIFMNSSGTNTIYDNYFNNTNNSKDNGNNTWNISKTAGRNIIGGFILGGNFWASSSGIGYSQTCTDGDTDGICDLPYPVTVDDTDFLPLAQDRTSPSGIIISGYTSGTTWINWTWTDPDDPDFSYVKVFIDGRFRSNVFKGIQFFNATGFLPNTRHTISTRTVDINGNENPIWKNHSAWTKKDTTKPASITDLTNISYATGYINWTWKDPLTPDFSYVKVYIDGKFRSNVNKGKKFFNATGFLPNTKHTISTRTVDTSGNINLTWINHTAWTKKDTTKPASITNLTNRSYSQTYINWTWTDPKDPDLSGVRVYIDGRFNSTVPKGRQFFNATGFLTNTTHTISTRTVDTSGNVNLTWKNSTARTR